MIALLAAVTGMSAAHGDWTPGGFTAYYSVQMGGLTIGESRRTLRADPNGGYIFESETHPRGIARLFVKDVVVERSHWTYTGEGVLRPAEYIYQRTGGRKERHVRLEFNWEDGFVINTINDDPWRMSIPPGTQDKLLYQLAVMRDLALGERHVSYEIADGGKLKTYEIAVVGEEQIDTPLGRMHTLKIARINDKRGTTLWCAEALDYLPVRIEQTETDGSQFKALIKSLDGRPQRAE